MSSSSECLESRCQKLGVRFVFLSYSNLTTDCRSCLVPTSALKDVQKNGCPLSPGLYFNMTTGPSYYSLHPDPSTLIQLPWNKEYAWVQCNVNHDGEVYEVCPRRVLLRTVAKAKEAGYVFKSGIEPEFFLVSKDGTRMHDTADCQQPLPLHDTAAIYRNLPLLTEMFDCMKELGWKPYQIFHEAANCQYEINFEYDDVIKTADKLCFFKFMAKQLAEKHGCRITFMPSPFPDLTSSGMHINLSVWDAKGEKNLHLDGGSGGDGGDGETSPITTHFVGGLLKYAKEYCAILCSTVNSYKRLNLGSWCPNTVSWGNNDKSILIRVPTKDRIEHRLSDAATNPHLAHAVMVACGVEGLTKKIEPPENSFGPDSRRDKERKVPLALNEALKEMEESVFLREVLGCKLVEDYVEFKRQEWCKYSKELSKWELMYYINC